MLAPYQMKTYKIIVIGDSNVGKTCLTYRFCDGKFLEESECTIGTDFREKIVNIGAESIKLQLWDTAGQERYRRSMVAHYYRSADAIVLVYDVSNTKSYESLKRWLEECKDYNLEHVPKILVGNKCDSEPNVPRYTAQVFADQHQMPFFETSAKLETERDNIESIFLTLAHKLKNNQPFRTNVVFQNLHKEETIQNKSICCFSS